MSIAIAGFGNGISQGVWNSWLVGMPSVNELMGFMHGFYGLGALITPLIAKAMVQTYGQPFWNFYYIMFGMNVLELILGVYAFWTATGDAHRAKLAKENQNTGGRMKGAISHTVTWMVSIFLFIYVATEVSLGGWISTFMTVINGGSLSDANTITTSFWASLTAGRMILGFVTPKFDEHLAVLTYLLICTFLQIFWLICYFARSAVIVGLQGFFIGPMFPSAVVLVSRILPAKLHVMAISFSAATGAGGTAM